MEDNIIIRRITTEDKEKLVELYDRVWPETAGEKNGKTSWAVDTSEYKGMCAEKDGIIIGSRMAFHANLYIGTDKLTSVQFGDSCVDKEYRRYGLFSRMNRAFLDIYFKTGYELIYNVSVEASKKAYQKVGWQYIDAYCGLLYSPNYLKLLWKLKGDIRKIGGNPHFEKSPIPDVDIIPDDLLVEREEKFVSACLIHNRYDKNTLKWRVNSNSGIRLFYQSELGACLYKIGSKHGLSCLTLGEIFPRDYSYDIISQILSILVKQNSPDIVNFSLSINHPLYKIIKKYGFYNNPTKKFLNLGVRVNTDIMKAVAYNPNNWGISSLDIDTF